MNLSKTLNIVMKVVFMTLFLLCVENIYSQAIDSTLRLTVKVEDIDSAYVFIPQLQIIDKNTSIRIHKELVYHGESDFSVDCNFFLTKSIGGTWVNMYTSRLDHTFPHEGYKTMRDYSINDKLKDTVNLGIHIPLDIGTYRIAINLKYYVNGDQRMVYSDEVEFEVNHLPKNSLFFN